MILCVVFLALMLGLGVVYQFYPNPRPLLSEEGQNLREFYQSLNQSKIDLAKTKGLIEAREKVIAEQKQILQAGEALAASGQAVLIDSVSYSQEKVKADLARRKRDDKFLRQTVDSNKVYQGKLEDIIVSLAERIAKIRIDFSETEAIKAELAALADYQLLSLSEIKAVTEEELPALLSKANGDFKEKLEQIKKSQRIDFFPDVLAEDFIATSSWLKQAAIYQAEQTEVKKRKEIEEQQRRQAEADQQRKAFEEEKLKQAEAEKQRKIAEEERLRQAEAESKRKAAEEQQRQQAEAESKRKQEEEERRLAQFEADRKIIEAEKDQQRQAEVEKQKQIDAVIADWQSFWLKFGVKADLSAVKISKYSPEFSRILIIPQGLTLNQTIRFCRDRFPVSNFWNDLDKAIVQNDRLPTQTYAVCLRDRREADKELRNLSAIALVEKKIVGITLLERLVYELKYFDETGCHLDGEGCTLCIGSRVAGGDIPCVNWTGHLQVSWSDKLFRDIIYYNECVRAVVY